MNEGEYLELCNQFKELNDKRDNENKKIKEREMLLKKEIISIYGLVRVISDLIDPSEIDVEINMLIDLVRGRLSEMVENHILNPI